jgi:kinesin family protein C1
MSVEVENSGEFVFDAVFDADASQHEVFDECRSLAQSVVDGYPVTLFCYGQTGAGKTYTMYGNEEHSGIAPRAMSELFRLCHQQADRRACRVYASMVELYNNDLADLLKVAGYDRSPGSSPSLRSGTTPRQNRSPRRHSLVSGAENPFTEVECFSAEELTTLLWDGFAQRHVAATAMNGDSSRSHVVLLIKVHSRDLITNMEHTGYMALVDLGGSERLKKSASTGEQQKEAIEINRSLTAIGDVLEALARGLRGPQVPYRNHKLTLLLQDALGGSSKTLMIVNVAPSAAHRVETVMAMRFGQRAGAVLNRIQQKKWYGSFDRKKPSRRFSSEDLSGLAGLRTGRNSRKCSLVGGA